MKKLKYMILITMTSIMFININCKPEPEPEPQLPPITHEGKNTFGCLVNGEVWLPDVDGGMGVIHELIADYYNSTFHISAKIHTKKQDQYMSISIFNSLKGRNNYSLNDKKPGSAFYDNYNALCYYQTDSFHIGNIEITYFDTLYRIISGTFEFTAYSEDCDTIRITEGRFDIKY